MDLQAYAELIGKLGAPIAFAAVLIWHVLKVNRSLSNHNRELLSQLARVTEQISCLDALQADLKNLRDHSVATAQLYSHCEELRKSLESERSQSRTLLGMLVEAQLKPTPVPEIAIGPPIEPMSVPNLTGNDLIAKNRHTYVHLTFQYPHLLDEAHIDSLVSGWLMICEKNESPRLLLDFAGVEHTSSGFWGGMITLWRTVREKKGRLALVNLDPQIEELLHLHKTIMIFDVFSETQSAIEYLTLGGTAGSEHRIKRRPAFK